MVPVAVVCAFFTRKIGHGPQHKQMTRVSEGNLQATMVRLCFGGCISERITVMDHNTAPQIQLCPDGSIDVEHYLRIAHVMRSKQAHHLAARLMSKPKSALGRIARLSDVLARKRQGQQAV
jgi:sulfatase maturation enzyme AslB (radical SAM superfamily)